MDGGGGMAKKSKYVEVDFGARDLTREERLSALEKIGAKSRSIHAETRQKLLDLLEANDAIAILARMGLRFLFTGAREGSAHGPVQSD